VFDRVAEAERRRWRAGSLSVAAGVAHGLVAPEHFREWWGYGLFFGLAAIGQVFYGALLLVAPWRYDDTGGLRTSPPARERAIYLAGAVGTSALIVLYALTRTVGVPLLGPEAGRIEPVTPLGVATKLLEAAAVVALLSLCRAPQRSTVSGNAPPG
jgi:hypothetical protein